MPTILICDDEPGVRFAIEEALASLGAEVVSVGSGREALARLAQADVVVTDLVMPELDGLALLAEVRAIDPDLPVILLTARGSERTAVAAIKAGAYDYLAKPFAVDELRLQVGRALELRALRGAARVVAVERSIGRPLVGASPAWTRVVSDARRVGRRDVTVLVRGETGTGKELVAALLHAESARRERPFVRFNCAAIPSELAEAELFGHARGAFTGAHASRAGYLQQADGGTLLLDEIGELPRETQAKLLRALQEGEIQPVGAGRVERVDVRVIAATHRDLRVEISAGRFREDLYYRLAVVELTVPPLRDRVEDIPLLVEAFRRRITTQNGEDVRFSDALVAALVARPWPGNVRELENAVQRLLALADAPIVDADALGCLDPDTPRRSSPQSGPLRERVAAYERGVLETTLQETGGNQSEAARRLGVTRVTLIEKMKRYGLRR